MPTIIYEQPLKKSFKKIHIIKKFSTPIIQPHSGHPPSLDHPQNSDFKYNVFKFQASKNFHFYDPRIYARKARNKAPEKKVLQ